MKTAFATCEMERDTFATKLKQKNRQMASLSETVTRMEAELVQSKQQLGDAVRQQSIWAAASTHPGEEVLVLEASDRIGGRVRTT